MKNNASDFKMLAAFVTRYRPLLVITGAGISTSAGIPDYRDADGAWKHSPPIQWQAFLTEPSTQQRYWARSMVGWPRFAAAQPSKTHRALAALQRYGLIEQIITQNVDGLHQQAGSTSVIELHGALSDVVCLRCASRFKREKIQRWLIENNADLVAGTGALRPDGDAVVPDQSLEAFHIPRCEQCHGPLKPDVVFFGDNVPRARVEQSNHHLERSGGLLVLGTSLMAYSSYRFCEQAIKKNLPVAAVNLGKTRADSQLTFKLNAPCDTMIPPLSRYFGRLASGGVKSTT